MVRCDPLTSVRYLSICCMVVSWRPMVWARVRVRVKVKVKVKVRVRVRVKARVCSVSGLGYLCKS